MPNQFGWPTPETDQLLTYMQFPPFQEPAESIAERLCILAHLAFNEKVWGIHTGRDYWVAFGQRIELSANSDTVSGWWEKMMDNLSGVPLYNDRLREKTLLIRPTTLPVTPVEDEEVLRFIRSHILELRDRTRLWVKDRRSVRQEETEEFTFDLTD